MTPRNLMLSLSARTLSQGGRVGPVEDIYYSQTPTTSSPRFIQLSIMAESVEFPSRRAILGMRAVSPVAVTYQVRTARCSS